MRCAQETAQETLSAYTDGELSEADRVALEAHLGGCGACRARIERLRALKVGVSRLEARADPPEAVRARVEALRFEPPSQERGKRPRWAVVGAVAALLLACVALWWLSIEVPWTQKVFEDHAGVEAQALPLEVNAETPAVLAYFEPHVAHDPVAPRLPEVSLVGGRLCSIEGDRVQLLYYKDGERHLSLYVSSRSLGPERCEREGVSRACMTRRGELTYVLVGERSEAGLKALLEGVAP